MTDSSSLVHSTVRTSGTSWHYQNYATARKLYISMYEGIPSPRSCVLASSHLNRRSRLSCLFRLTFNYLLVISLGLRGKTRNLIFWAGFIARIKTGNRLLSGSREKLWLPVPHCPVISLTSLLSFFPRLSQFTLNFLLCCYCLANSIKTSWFYLIPANT
jgi:hypothetical protein